MVVVGLGAVLLIGGHIVNLRLCHQCPWCEASLPKPAAPRTRAKNRISRQSDRGWIARRDRWGIKIAGWEGRIDPSEEKAGMTIKDALLAKERDSLHVVTGPAVSYWKTGDKASGDYTVKATFTEPKYMNLNTHPHPYGVFISGNDEGTLAQTDLYCEAYGNGNFIVRGFGPASFQMNGRGESNAVVHKAAGQGQPVTQEIALSVKGGKVECAINGIVVASYDKAAIVTDGKLKSTDGVFGLRFAHNTEVMVTGFALTKN